LYSSQTIPKTLPTSRSLSTSCFILQTYANAHHQINTLKCQLCSFFKISQVTGSTFKWKGWMKSWWYNWKWWETSANVWTQEALLEIHFKDWIPLAWPGRVKELSPGRKMYRTQPCLPGLVCENQCCTQLWLRQSSAWK
jgi:hypothetical protein